METRQACSPSTSYAVSEDPRHNRPRRRCPPPPRAQAEHTLNRRQLALLAPLLLPDYDAEASTHERPAFAPPSGASAAPPLLPPPPVAVPNYAQRGPLQPIRLPQLEHTCTTCVAPAELCRLKIHSWVPKGGGRIGMAPPYPLVVITPGFLVPSLQYESYAERLASWGYVCVAWESPQQALDPASDLVLVSLLRDLLDWCRTAAPLGALCDTTSVLLAGHSRGAKISALAAAQDSRVQALFLVDPVDSTPWAPLSTNFPSAAAALAALPSGAARAPPVAVVGSALGGDCAPIGSNYATFFDAAAGPAWEVVVRDAGHLQFLDSRGGSAMDLACAAGKAPDAEVAELARAMMVAWAETMLRGGGRRPRDDAGGQGQGTEAPALPPPLLCGLNGEGNVVAGLASFNALQALYATEDALRRGGRLDLNTRLKNFAMP